MKLLTTPSLFALLLSEQSMGPWVCLTMKPLCVADLTTPPGRSSAQLVASYRYLRSFEKVAHADSVEFEHPPGAVVVECGLYGTRSARGRHGDLNLR